MQTKDIMVIAVLIIAFIVINVCTYRELASYDLNNDNVNDDIKFKD